MILMKDVLNVQGGLMQRCQLILSTRPRLNVSVGLSRKLRILPILSMYVLGLNTFSVSFRESIHAELDDKLTSFGSNIIEFLNEKFEEKFNQLTDRLNISQDVSNCPSFPAPHQVPGRLPSRRLSAPDSDPQQGSNNHEATRDGPVPGESLDSPPILSPEATQSLASLESLRSAGVISEAAFKESRDNLVRQARLDQGPGPSRIPAGDVSGDGSPLPADLVKRSEVLIT